MKTCKDCIGDEFCSASWRRFEEQDIKAYTNGDIRDLCRCFKDKSKFIELPCSIGDTVYMIVYGYDTWDDDEFKTIIQAPFRLNMLSDFNKRFFLTREDAEKKMEELSNVH